MARKTAREATFLLLFESEMGGGSADSFEEFIKPELTGPITKDDKKYIENVAGGVMENIETLDEAIGRFAVGWTTERMAKVDLTIMRIASYEILYRDDVPDGVAVNEAVELCAKYSTDGAGSFVNGVLGNLSRNKQAEDK